MAKGGRSRVVPARRPGTGKGKGSTGGTKVSGGSIMPSKTQPASRVRY